MAILETIRDVSLLQLAVGFLLVFAAYLIGVRLYVDNRISKLTGVRAPIAASNPFTSTPTLLS